MDLLFILPHIVKAAAEAGPGTGSQVVIAALGAGSVGAVIAAVVTGLFTKRKLGAEATEIITKAASGVVENLNAEITRVNGVVATLRAEREEDRIKYEREISARDRVLQLHVAWDMLVRAKLAEHGIELPEPPPLRPPLPGFPSDT